MSLPDRLGESRTPEIMAYARWPIVGSVSAALAFGAMGYLGGPAGIVVLGGAAAKRAGGGMAAPPAASAPNAPIISATVYRAEGDSLWVDGGTFVGSGADTHDSTELLVDTAGGDFSAPQYFADTLGAVERDSLAADSGAVVDIIMRYKGASGGWSDPDTLTGVDMTRSLAVPSFGDNGSDVLIRSDDFEGYANLSALQAQYGSEDKSLGTDGGHGGDQYIRQAVGSGTEGRQVVFAQPSSDPTHYFVDYWFRLDTQDPGAMKWLIVHHDAEPGILRYQFDASQVAYGGGPGWDHPGSTAPEEGRFGGRWEPNTQIDGPVNGVAGEDTEPIFVWDNGGAIPHKEAAPVWTSDEDIGLTPWGPLDDGNWHRHTVEIKLGQGTNGYSRAWIDGHPYIDSSTGPMNYVGVPENSTYWESEAAPDGHKAFNIDIDDITVWER